MREQEQLEEASSSSRGAVMLPERTLTPWQLLRRRIFMAFVILFGTVMLVYLDRDGYKDSADGAVSFIDAMYYTTVTLSTTGYGDITPASSGARLVNAFVITPARIIFLVLLIGTSLEVLTAQSREMIRVARWRKKMQSHIVVIGYGTKGRSAVDTLLQNGLDKEQLVIVDPGSAARADARADGLAVVVGDATQRHVLLRARVQEADQIIITTNRDDTNVLSALTVRQLNPDATVVATVRERANVPLMRQSGANSVVLSADSVGRMLGLSTVSPNLGSILEDLLTYGQGLEVAERKVLGREVGRQPQSVPDQVVGVVRDGRLHYYFDPSVSQLEGGDKLIVVRPSEEKPWAPRPGTHGERTGDDREEPDG